MSAGNGRVDPAPPGTARRTRRRTQVLTDSLVDVGGLTWSTDGYVYYDGHLAGDGLARVRETGGRPEIASRPNAPSESWHSHPSALPNGRGVLFSVARLRGASPFDIAVLDSRTGEHRVLFRGLAPRPDRRRAELPRGVEGEAPAMTPGRCT